MPTDINTTKTRIHRLLQSATPEPETKTQKPNKTIPALLIICLLGSMLPLQFATAFFSLGFLTVTVLLLTLTWNHKLKTTNTAKALVVALTLTSVLSGCSPAFTFQNPPEMIKFANQNSLEVYSMQKFGILGLGLDSATIEMAQAKSKIKELRGAQIDKGHGLINIVTITIAGKS